MFIVKPTTKKGQKVFGLYCTDVKKIYAKYEAKADAEQAAAVLNAKADADKNLQVLKWIDPNTDATGN